MNNIVASKINVADLEKLLDGTLRPVQARPAYVADLRSKLLGDRTAGERTQTPIETNNLILLIVAALTSVLFLATGLRAFISIAGGLGFMQMMRKQQRSTNVAVLTASH